MKHIDQLENLLNNGYTDNDELIAFALVALVFEQKRLNDALLAKLEFLNVNDWGEIEIATVDRGL